ncbi:MAG: flagellar basal body rod protein FlgC [Desulfobacterales bacterium]|jgi:flagellar basal-body rod protein FlgC|nr:flagellar basal body rod protein FlgC [Desulfobacterales bacterium]MCU0584527.1 flagellar basal body rod protein FlgC [Desulfobacterales bacterium]
MDMFDALHISSSGLSAQRLRMNLISANLANANTTRTPEGGPYRRKEVVFEARPRAGSFREMLRARHGLQPAEVRAVKVFDDPRPPVSKFDPGHPDADALGYVRLPNVNMMEEMVNMISATRSYEANVTAIKAAKEMALKALEIGK